MATCSLKVGALETGWRADEKFTGWHTMNDWRQEAAGKPNRWVSNCFFVFEIFDVIEGFVELLFCLFEYQNIT